MEDPVQAVEVSVEKTCDLKPEKDTSSEKIKSNTEKDSPINFKTPILPPLSKPKWTEDKNVITTPTDKALKKENSKSEPSDKKEETENKSTVEHKSPDTEASLSKPLSKLSPAEQLQQSRIAIPYKEPSWGDIAEEEYRFEVLKNGTIIDNVKLDKSFIVFGRLPSCDVPMEHPSLSRHHAVVQFCKTPTPEQEKGWYLYDLDSTHGTWINKNKVYPKKYYRIRVGHVLKFGGSSRLHILQVRIMPLQIFLRGKNKL